MVTKKKSVPVIFEPPCTWCSLCGVFCTDLRTDSDICFIRHYWLVFITVGKSVYSAVRTDSLYKKSRLRFVFKGLKWWLYNRNRFEPNTWTREQQQISWFNLLLYCTRPWTMMQSSLSIVQSPCLVSNLPSGHLNCSFLSFRSKAITHTRPRPPGFSHILNIAQATPHNPDSRNRTVKWAIPQRVSFITISLHYTTNIATPVAKSPRCTLTLCAGNLHSATETVRGAAQLWNSRP
jgi:hypothetical protein